jgi:hypothetical protein
LTAVALNAASSVNFHACVVQIARLLPNRCQPLGFSLFDWLQALAAAIAILGSLAAGIRWAFKRFPIRKRRIRSFRALCRKLDPIITKNGRSFANFGPNSGIGDGQPKVVRENLGVWRGVRADIAKNNEAMKRLVEEHWSLVPMEHRVLFEIWLDHISAFSQHVRDPLADYRDHKFPIEIARVVRNGVG